MHRRIGYLRAMADYLIVCMKIINRQVSPFNRLIKFLRWLPGIFNPGNKIHKRQPPQKNLSIWLKNIKESDSTHTIRNSSMISYIKP